MSHRQKNKHQSRHRTHPVKSASLAKFAPGPKLLSIKPTATPTDAGDPGSPETVSAPRAVEL